jgi:hypothetical protein
VCDIYITRNFIIVTLVTSGGLRSELGGPGMHMEFLWKSALGNALPEDREGYGSIILRCMFWRWMELSQDRAQW